MKYRSGIISTALTATVYLTGCSPTYHVGKNYRITQDTIDTIIDQLRIDPDATAWMIDANGDKMLSNEEIRAAMGALEGLFKPLPLSEVKK